MAEVPSHVGGFGMEDSSLVILLDAGGSLFPADGVEDSAVGYDLRLERMVNRFDFRLSSGGRYTSFVGGAPTDEVIAKVSEVTCLGVMVIEITTEVGIALKVQLEEIGVAKCLL